METKLTEIENLYGYVFWYNPYVEVWYAIPTTKYTEFFSGNKEPKGVMSSDKVETLITLIGRPELTIR